MGIYLIDSRDLGIDDTEINKIIPDLSVENFAWSPDGIYFATFAMHMNSEPQPIYDIIKLRIFGISGKEYKFISNLEIPGEHDEIKEIDWSSE